MKENSDPVSEENQGEGGTDLVSHHVFLLPFKWVKKDEEVLSYQSFNALAAAYDNDEDWKNEQFELTNVVKYNEYHYFYDFVRDVLYDEANGDAIREGRKKYIRHFSRKNAEGGIFKITTPKPKHERPADREYDKGYTDESFRKTYMLDIDDVQLHLYYTGVGVLSIHLHNRDRDSQGHPDDILYINQYGRRILPAFFKVPHQYVGQQSINTFAKFSENVPTGDELAYELSLTLKGDEQISERWEFTDEAIIGKDWSALLPAFVKQFFKPINDSKASIHPVLDDRMFVVCWYGNDTYQDLGADPGYISMENIWRVAHDWWYKFVFVDANDVTVQNQEVRRELIRAASYRRWTGYSTYYGITDYSFVLSTGTLEHLQRVDINATFLVTHLQTIYFKLAELVLVQRACVQRFSDEVTRVSRLDEGQEIQLAAAANRLYQKYIRFVNRIYFREVTAQVQGIELYRMLHNQSRLRDAVESLNEEIAELNTYVQQLAEKAKLKQQEARNERLENLNFLAALFFPPGILLAVYATPAISEPWNRMPYSYLITIVAVVLSVLLAYLAYRNKTMKWFWAALIVFLFLLLIPEITPRFIEFFSTT